MAEPKIPALTPPPAPLPIVQPVRPPAQRAQANIPASTLFDGPPRSTVAARAAAERARTNMQAAVRAVANARAAADELARLAAADPAAAAIAEHEGVGPEILARFAKSIDPLLSAFLSAA